MAILQSSSSLTLAAADAMADAAIKAVGDLQTHKPMCVTVLDSAGGVLVQKRMDGCPSGAYTKFSYAKARTCIHLQSSSRGFREKYTTAGEAPKFTQAAAMVSVMEGELIPVAGGVAIKSADGSIVGAIGVSGAAADEDEYLGWKGVQSVAGGITDRAKKSLLQNSEMNLVKVKEYNDGRWVQYMRQFTERPTPVRACRSSAARCSTDHFYLILELSLVRF